MFWNVCGYNQSQLGSYKYLYFHFELPVCVNASALVKCKRE